MKTLTMPLDEEYVLEVRYRIFFAVPLTQRLLWEIASAESIVPSIIAPISSISPASSFAPLTLV